MGRMLETLKKADGNRPVSPPNPPQHLKSAAPEDCVPEWAVSETPTPFIEVGGPGRSVEGSAEVMAVAPHPAQVHPAQLHPPQAKQPPHPPLAKALAPSTILAQLTHAKPLIVAFEPWTGAAAGSSGFAPDIIAYHQPTHAISKQYAELWNTMIAGLPEPGSHVLLLAGLRPQVGTTTVLVNLAVTGALHAKRRTAIVDAQTRQPGVAQRLGIKPDMGLLDVIAGQAALEQTLVKTLLPSLFALPLAQPRTDVALTPEAAVWLLGRLRERFEVILIDGPTVVDTAALAAVAPCCDAMFLVAPQGEAKALPREALLTVSRLGGKLRGLLHTHFEM